MKVLCKETGPYKTSLRQGKVYDVIPDSDAESYGMVRIVDETGGAYTFPLLLFKEVRVRREVRRNFRTRA